MNPFSERPEKLEKLFEGWKQLYPKSYSKHETDPYTKTRIILMNGTEFEANWFSHQMSRHTADTELRRRLALTRAFEKQQQLKISLLKPCDESALEHTISYEQLAVDLTAELAAKEKDCYVKTALDFALLEDFDHLYRYANKLEMDDGIHAEELVGRYTEIMPGRPTIAHHRYPEDNVRRCINSKTADKCTVLATMIITAAEQQTMNYYMNISNLAPDDSSRKLYREICLVEEEHVTQYGNLIDANATWFEMLLWHEYAECYLYWSCYMTETDKYIRSIWEKQLIAEIAHLHDAADLLKKHEKKEWNAVIPDGKFPEPLSLHENIEYVRNILANTVQFTSLREDYTDVASLGENADFFRWQKLINGSISEVESHNVIKEHIARCGADYRFTLSPSPVKGLQSQTSDNTDVGRKAGAAGGKGFTCA